jgi:DNA polymerase III delta subunit
VLSDFQGAFTYVDVSPPRGAEFEKALKYISPDCEIDAKLASFLAESGADLWQINIWLEQGANLVEKPGRLTLEALQDFIDLGGLASIWNLLDAVGEREVQKAQILLQDLIRNREKPSILLWHLKELFFHLNLICKIRQRGVNPEKFRAELTKKYIHDFRFNKFCQQSLNYSVAEVEQALLKIQESDLKLKTATNTDPNSLLIELLDAIVNR